MLWFAADGERRRGASGPRRVGAVRTSGLPRGRVGSARPVVEMALQRALAKAALINFVRRVLAPHRSRVTVGRTPVSLNSRVFIDLPSGVSLQRELVIRRAKEPLCIDSLRQNAVEPIAAGS